MTFTYSLWSLKSKSMKYSLYGTHRSDSEQQFPRLKNTSSVVLGHNCHHLVSDSLGHSFLLYIIEDSMRTSFSLRAS
jgi:hypothetical protein